MRVKWRAVAAVSAALVMAGCTVKVAGSASPVPGQGPVKKVVDACTLLSPEQVDALGFRPGAPHPASEQTRSPAMCTYRAKDDSATPSPIFTVEWAVDQNLDEFLSGAVAKGEPEQLGGLNWTRYGSIIASECDIYTTLGEKSFASVGVMVGEDVEQACQIAKKIAPVVASHLPGGAPAPSITPSTSAAPPEPTGPLASLDPCTLLKADQTAQLKVEDKGEKDNSSTVPNGTFCLWKDTDGDGAQKSFEVWLGPSTAATQWTGADVPATGTVEAGGKTWSLYPNLAGTRVNCGAILPMTETSSIEIVSGFIGDDSKNCDLVKQGIPLVTANLPVS